MKFVKSIPALAIATLLAACNSQGDGVASNDQPTADATPDPDKPVSILRPDVEQPEQEPVKLEPLRLVIGFPEGGNELDAAANAVLTTVVESEQVKGSASITLRGHSDAGGSDTANERTSLARAEAVRDWLVEKGVAKDRITVIAFGEQNPLKPNALPNGDPNEAGRAANRRVEIEIIPLVETPAPSPKAGD